MSVKLPYGGEAITKLRNQGKRPADMVLISLIGNLQGENNPVVIAQPGRRYDWRFLADLECLIVTDSSQPKDAIRQITDALKSLPVAYLGLWFADLQNGINFIVDGVTARPNGLLRHMSNYDREQFAGLGLQSMEALCA
jgi:hypothetical protein